MIDLVCYVGGERMRSPNVLYKSGRNGGKKRRPMARHPIHKGNKSGDQKTPSSPREGATFSPEKTK